MSYLIYNHTNYGDGVYIAGTVKSKKRAEALVKAIESEDDYKNGAGWRFEAIDSLDKYTDESIIEFARSLDK